MSESNDEPAPSSEDRAERDSTRPPLRLNLLRWDSEWLRQRLARVQHDLDRAVEELDTPSDT